MDFEMGDDRYIVRSFGLRKEVPEDWLCFFVLRDICKLEFNSFLS